MLSALYQSLLWWKMTIKQIKASLHYRIENLKLAIACLEKRGGHGIIVDEYEYRLDELEGFYALLTERK